MSHQSFVDFYENYLSSAEGETLKAKMEALADPDEFCATVAAAGSASGYDFSEDDVRQVMRASEAKMAREVAAANGELADEQLDDVTGGVSYSFSSIPTVDIRMSTSFIDSSQLSYKTIMCPW